MFYNNRNTNINAMVLLLSATHNLKLVNNIHQAYENVNLKDILDVEIKSLVECVKILSNDIFQKEIRTPKQAKMYFELASIPEDIKLLVNESLTSLSDKVLDEYTVYFANIANHTELASKVEKINEAWDKLAKSGLSKITKNTEEFIEIANDYGKVINKFTRDTTDYNDFVINMVNREASFGYDRIESDLNKYEANRLKTGTFIDHLTGGGFRPEGLYIVASISGGFKSGFLQNIAEEISCHMEVDDFIVPDGMTPALLYVNLEMSNAQLLARKIDFYDADYEYITKGNGEGNTLEDRMYEVLKANNASIPVIYLSEDSTSRKYTTHKLKTAIQRYEQAGFKIVGLITDYLDKFKFNSDEAPSERERDEPLTLKAYEHKDIAKEFKIPVITGAQLNREGEKVLKDKLHKAGYEDIVKGCNPSVIGKAHSLTNVPDQIYFAYRFSVGDDENANDYFSIVVDKDRDGEARYVPRIDKGEKERKSIAKKKRGDSRVHYCVKIPKVFNTMKNKNVSSFRIGNDYGSTIKDFEDNSDVYEIFNVDNNPDDIILEDDNPPKEE